nr:uncharacterized protein LOC129387408 [Dermacentor andersoni]
MDPTTDASTKMNKSLFRRRSASKGSDISQAADSEGPGVESTRQTRNLSRRKKSKARRRSRRLPSSSGVGHSPSAEEGDRPSRSRGAHVGIGPLGRRHHREGAVPPPSGPQCIRRRRPVPGVPRPRGRAQCPGLRACHGTVRATDG